MLIYTTANLNNNKYLPDAEMHPVFCVKGSTRFIDL